jgi:hypothetical protein
MRSEKYATKWSIGIAYRPRLSRRTRRAAVELYCATHARVGELGSAKCTASNSVFTHDQDLERESGSIRRTLPKGLGDLPWPIHMQPTVRGHRYWFIPLLSWPWHHWPEERSPRAYFGRGRSPGENALPSTTKQPQNAENSSKNYLAALWADRTPAAGIGRLGRSEKQWEKEGDGTARVTVSIRKGGAKPLGRTRHSDWGGKGTGWRRDKVATARGGPTRVGLTMCSGTRQLAGWGTRYDETKK